MSLPQTLRYTASGPTFPRTHLCHEAGCHPGGPASKPAALPPTLQRNRGAGGTGAEGTGGSSRAFPGGAQALPVYALLKADGGGCVFIHSLTLRSSIHSLEENTHEMLRGAPTPPPTYPRMGGCSHNCTILIPAQSQWGEVPRADIRDPSPHCFLASASSLTRMPGPGVEATPIHLSWHVRGDPSSACIGSRRGPDSNPARSSASSGCRAHFFYLNLGFATYKMGLKVVSVTCWGNGVSEIFAGVNFMGCPKSSFPPTSDFQSGTHNCSEMQ